MKGENLNSLTNAEKIRIFEDLIKEKIISAEEINHRIDLIREETEERLVMAAKTSKADISGEAGTSGVESQEKELSPEQAEKLLETLQARFEAHMERHKGISWESVMARLEEAFAQKLWSLNEMERTGGEPDVTGFDEATGEYIFFDCSKESPQGRRNICYDREGQNEAEKKGQKPNGNAVDMAAAMGIELLTEEQYRFLQNLGEFDQKSWMWLKTPFDIRKTGCALYGYRVDDVVGVAQDRAYIRDDFKAFRGSLRV